MYCFTVFQVICQHMWCRVGRPVFLTTTQNLHVVAIAHNPNAQQIQSVAGVLLMMYVKKLPLLILSVFQRYIDKNCFSLLYRLATVEQSVQIAQQTYSLCDVEEYVPLQVIATPVLSTAHHRETSIVRALHYHPSVLSSVQISATGAFRTRDVIIKTVKYILPSKMI